MQKAEAFVWSVHAAASSASSLVHISMSVVSAASSCGVSVACVTIDPFVGWPAVELAYVSRNADKLAACMRRAQAAEMNGNSSGKQRL